MFESILSWVLRALTGALEWFFNSIDEAFELDMDKFTQYFPVVTELYKVVVGIALGLVIGITIINLLRFFLSPVEKRVENPLTLLLRSAAAIFFIFYGDIILNWIIELFKGPYGKLLHDTFAGAPSNSGSTVKNFATVIVSDTFLPSGMASGAKNFISLFAILALAINVIKFILEFVERWVIIGCLVFLGPLGWCTMASEATKGIFSKWINMFLSQNMLMLISAWSLRMMFSILNASTTDPAQLFFRLLAALAFCRLAQRFDTYMQSLGLNAATTGGSLLDEILGARAMAAGLMKSKGGAGGAGGNGESLLGAETGAVGTGGYSKAGALGGVWGMGALAAAKAVKGAARGVSAGYSAARGQGKNIKESLGEGAKQAGHNVLNGAIPFSRSASIESKVRQAMASKAAGDSSSFDKLTDAEKNLASRYSAETEKSGERPLPYDADAIGGFKQYADGTDSSNIDAQAERSGYFEETIDDGEGHQDNVVLSEYGDAHTAAFVQKGLIGSAYKDADGKKDYTAPTDAQFEKLNNTTRHLSDSDKAIGMDTSHCTQEQQSQIWASSMQSCGVGTSSSYKNIASKDSSGAWKGVAQSMDSLSRGRSDGNITIDKGWSRDSSSGGHETKFSYSDKGSGKVYDVTVMDKTQFDHYSKINGKEAAKNFRMFNDKHGNTRYMSMHDPSADAKENSGGK